MEPTIFGSLFFPKTKKYAQPGDIILDNITEERYVWDGEYAHRPLRIGLDHIGVFKTQKEGTDFDLPNANKSLIELQTRHKLYLISYSDAKHAIETTKYINSIPLRIFDKTFFVTENKYKHNICKACHIDVMIDNSVDVLNMIDLPIHKIYFVDDSLNNFDPIPSNWKGHVAKDWNEVLQIIDKLSIVEIEDISQYCHLKYEN